MKVLQLFSLVRFTPPEYIRSATDNAARTHTHTCRKSIVQECPASKQHSPAPPPHLHRSYRPRGVLELTNSACTHISRSLARISFSLSLSLSRSKRNPTQMTFRHHLYAFIRRAITMHRIVSSLCTERRTPPHQPLTEPCVCAHNCIHRMRVGAHTGGKYPSKKIYIYMCVQSTQNVRLHRLREADACDCDCQITFNRTRDTPTQPSKNSFSPNRRTGARIFALGVVWMCIFRALSARGRTNICSSSGLRWGTGGEGAREWRYM